MRPISSSPRRRSCLSAAAPSGVPAVSWLSAGQVAPSPGSETRTHRAPRPSRTAPASRGTSSVRPMLLLEGRAQAPQDLVVVDPAAEHPPVGPRLQPTAHRLEGDGHADRQEHRQLDRDLATEREPRRGRQRHVHRADPEPGTA